MKAQHWVGVGLGICVALYLVYTHLQFFGDLSFLGGILLLEVLIVCLWNYEQRFFVFLLIAFVWAGMHVPLQGTWTAGRWAVLAAGAAAGYAVWLKNPRRPFGTMHLLAFFCVCAAFVSATVSQYVQMASLKACSLLLLFLYCSSGARLAVIDREEPLFFWAGLGKRDRGLRYCILLSSAWADDMGESKLLPGAAMSIGLFPVLLWGWLTSEGPGIRARRLGALLLCTYLVFFSMARAGIVSITVVTLIFCVCLRQYKLLMKSAALLLVLIAVTGIYDPAALNSRLGNSKKRSFTRATRAKGCWARGNHLGRKRFKRSRSIRGLELDTVPVLPARIPEILSVRFLRALRRCASTVAAT